MNIMDCRGLACPQPVINTKKALDGMVGGSLTVIVDNVVARENVLKFARHQGCVAEATEENGVYQISISKGQSAPEPQPSMAAYQIGTGEAALYLIKSDSFGQGSTELGSALMKTFLYALSEATAGNNHLVCINAGVKLVCEGSPVLDSIRRLGELGWEIKACGTCLDYYGLKEKLRLGEITNMYTIVELMEQCAKVVSV